MDLSGATILIVDDEPDLRDLLAIGFEELGCTILEANSGKEGFKVVANRKVDIVISDIRMPGGSGLDLLRDIQTKRLDSPPSVFFITGFADVTEQEALDRGAIGLFSKPFEIGKIINAVKSRLNKAA